MMIKRIFTHGQRITKRVITEPKNGYGTYRPQMHNGTRSDSKIILKMFYGPFGPYLFLFLMNRIHIQNMYTVDIRFYDQ